MPLLTDEKAAAIATAKFQLPTTKTQLQALSYLEENVLRLIHQDELFVDVEQVFAAYDTLYFDGFMKGIVDVVWSSRMTLCAGTCELKPDNHKRKSSSTWPEGIMVRIKLSEPILKFRAGIDLLNTLIHEMIHAYLFIAGGKHVRGDDPSGHGAGFLLLARAINEHSNGFYNITVYHNFHDEVDHYRTHIWKCTGPCTSRPPYFGLVKRAMNRAPGPSDSWWDRHHSECGGTYIKIAEPQPKKGVKVKQTYQLDKWLKVDSSASGQRNAPDSSSPATASSDLKKRKRTKMERTNADTDAAEMDKRTRDDKFDLPKDDGKVEVTISCPICNNKIWEADIDAHLHAVHLDS